MPPGPLTKYRVTFTDRYGDSVVEVHAKNQYDAVLVAALELKARGSDPVSVEEV